MLTMVRQIHIDFEGQGNNSLCNALPWRYTNASVVPSMCVCVRLSMLGHCEHNRDYTVTCFFVKLCRYVNHDERMNPIDFFRSKVTLNIPYRGNFLWVLIFAIMQTVYRAAKIKTAIIYSNRISKVSSFEIAKIKIAKVISHTFTFKLQNFRPQKFPAIWYMEISLWTQ